MSEFKTRLLGFSALAMAFAGLSYGQVTKCTAADGVSNPSVRAEGEAELTGDPIVNCLSSGTAVTGFVYVSTSVPITGKSAATTKGGTKLTGGTDVVLEVGGAAYPGTISSSQQIMFSGVNLPGTNFTAIIHNLRVNASAASNPQITATVSLSFVQDNNTLNVTSGAQNVAYALPSLKAALADGATKSFKTCQGISLSATPAFTLNIQQQFSGAFKLKSVNPDGSGGESGDWTAEQDGLPAKVGLATQATQIQVTFANVPQNAKVYVPLSVQSSNTNTILNLTAAFTKDTAGSTKAGVDVALLSVSNVTNGVGTATATYEVIKNDVPNGTTIPVQVFISAGANAVPVQTQKIAVAAAYAPSGAAASPQDTVPFFAASSATPIDTLNVVACNTTLLFPYVTTAQGYDTGIAIANTTTDNLKSDGTSSATGTPGSCTLNFYGDSATNPAAFKTDTIGAYDATTTPATTPVFAKDLLLGMSVPAEFSGYVIASCNFLDAHGYAFLLNGGIAQGYLAVVIPNDRSNGSSQDSLGN